MNNRKEREEFVTEKIANPEVFTMKLSPACQSQVVGQGLVLVLARKKDLLSVLTVACESPAAVRYNLRMKGKVFTQDLRPGEVRKGRQFLQYPRRWGMLNCRVKES